MSAFRQGSALRNAALVKNLSAIACAVLPLFLTAYTGLAKNHEMPVSVEDMGLLITFLIGAIGAISTVITSPKAGLPARDQLQRIEA